MLIDISLHFVELVNLAELTVKDLFFVADPWIYRQLLLDCFNTEAHLETL